jgi:general L-amino acid transport system permease protein
MFSKSLELPVADGTKSAWPVRRVLSAVATGTAIVLAAWVAWVLLRWAVLDATWRASSSAECNPQGACWAVIGARGRLVMFGLYPMKEEWRAALGCAVVVGSFVVLQWSALWQVRRISGVMGCAAVVFLVLMYGALPGMAWVPTDKWGGFALTLFLYLCAVVLGFPVGIGLALLRRSQSPAIAWVAGFVVDSVRTLPMVMVLFTVGVLTPMLFPGAPSGDKLWRVALAFAFVYGCYQSEIVRAGLQAVAHGQEEAAKALALSPYLRLRLVMLPQGLTNGLPASVNLLVATFKETSIVAIIGFFDFTASAQAAYGTAAWANAYVEVYLFIGAVYFACATAIGWLGHRLEQRLGAARA